MLFVEFFTCLLHIVSQAKQAIQRFTEEICLVSEAMSYTEVSLFYLMHAANSNSVLLVKFFTRLLRIDKYIDLVCRVQQG